MAMGGGTNGNSLSTLSEINVTPLVDVMLVLLIIFMVTASVETMRAEQELEQIRVERDLVPAKLEKPENPLKDVPVIVPNTTVQSVEETERQEPKVVLAGDLTFRLDDKIVVDCKVEHPALVKLPHTGTDSAANRLFSRCAARAAKLIGPNALIQEKKRVNFAADRSIPWAWATEFMALMGVQHGIRQVNVIVTNQPESGESPK